MKALKFTLPALILAGGIAITSVNSYGVPAYTKKEKKGCIVCHTSAGSKELNNVGKCYEKNKKMEGCEAEKK